MQKKSILLIMPYGSVGGMERLALTFYNYYKKQGYKIKALKLIKLESDIINFEDDELYFKPYDLSDMTVVERFIFYTKIPFLLRGIIKKFNITHSIAFGDMANIASSLTFTKDYKIGSIHALKSVEFKNKTFLNKIFKLAFQTSYKFLDKVVCISSAIKHDLIENCSYKFSNLQVIYNPHNINQIINSSKELITEEVELKIFSKKTILFLGRLSIQKSPWHLINAFSILNKKKEDVNLVIIGDGDQKVTDYVKNQIKEFGLENNVFLLGRKNNPYKYINACNVLVLTSHYEGTPNVIVESIALGTPIVTSYCTKGIMELMSFKAIDEQANNIVLDSGIVTPNFFKGILGIPENKEFIKEESLLAEALAQVLKDNTFKNSLEKIQSKLLIKFNLEHVAKTYLTK